MKLELMHSRSFAPLLEAPLFATAKLPQTIAQDQTMPARTVLEVVMKPLLGA
jgi:hypothetical protein